MVPLIATGPEVYVATMISVLSNFYDSLVETLDHMKSLKLNYHPSENVAECCDEILVDADFLERDGDFSTNHLGYIIYIFGDTSDYIFHFWTTQK